MSCKSREGITLNEHFELGKRIKRAEHSVHELLSVSYRFNERELDTFRRFDKTLALIKSRLTDEAFSTHPWLTDKERFAIYYGNPDEMEKRKNERFNRRSRPS